MRGAADSTTLLGLLHVDCSNRRLTNCAARGYQVAVEVPAAASFLDADGDLSTQAPQSKEDALNQFDEEARDSRFAAVFACASKKLKGV
jgi:hypothetical protein